MDSLSLGLFALGLPVLLFLWMRFVSRKERSVFSRPENAGILSNAKKEGFGFKIATTILFLLCLVPAIFLFFICFIAPRRSTGSGAEVIFLIGLFLFIPIILSSATIFAGYNYLCLVKKDRSAKIILTIPFVPIFLTLIAAMSFDWSLAVISLVVFSPQLIGWLVMLYKLSKRRTRFRSLYLKQNSDSVKIREQAYFSNL